MTKAAHKSGKIATRLKSEGGRESHHLLWFLSTARLRRVRKNLDDVELVWLVQSQGTWSNTETPKPSSSLAPSRILLGRQCRPPTSIGSLLRMSSPVECGEQHAVIDGRNERDEDLLCAR
eukprot:CAMPEP_0198132686 /NCGR_PEP_ID=MMETSP1442-20131203/58869_1 /TAXON_ID= /ORGANISM="Craspedostauros australis, Strain CCMP3328" /LENGTH=119 /DNA_ID=CAMNT_0043793749 /DNA_START=165 /DNA_END=521 /DNA_ORIENTATION=-